MKSIGVGIPTYQRQDKLEEILQTIPAHIPVYVSDNGATLSDNIEEKYPNIHVKKILSVVPMFRNWTLAGMQVNEDWLLLPSDDDLMMEDAFLTIEKVLTKCSDDVAMIVFGHHIIGENSEILATWKPKNETCKKPNGFLKFKFGVDARMPSILIKTDLFRKLGGFCEDFKITASDSDFIQRASLISDVQFVSKVISGYRVWDGGATAMTIASQDWMEEIDMWCNRISTFCTEYGIDLYSKKIWDEIYASNLNAGLAILKKGSGYRDTWQHFRRCRYPFRATLKTQLRIIYQLVRL